MAELNELMNKKCKELLARFENLVDYFATAIESQVNCVVDLSKLIEEGKNLKPGSEESKENKSQKEVVYKQINAGKGFIDEIKKGATECKNQLNDLISEYNAVTKLDTESKIESKTDNKKEVIKE